MIFSLRETPMKQCYSGQEDILMENQILLRYFGLIIQDENYIQLSKDNFRNLDFYGR